MMTRPVWARSFGVMFVSGLVACGGGEAADGTGEVPLFASPRRAEVQAPEVFQARFETTQGAFVVHVERTWAPRGADRFYSLVRSGYYDDTRVYRIVPGFMAQFGVHADPRVTAIWRRYPLVDDSVRISNERGAVTFAKDGPNSRATQVFVNLDDNPALDGEGFAPFGLVVEGMDVVEALYAEYGDGPPRGTGPFQNNALARGNAYLDEDFPLLDRIERAVLLEGDSSGS